MVVNREKQIMFQSGLKIVLNHWCLPINIFKEFTEIKELMKYKSVKMCNLKDYTANSHIS